VATTVGWYREKQIILAKVIGELSLSDISESSAQIITLLTQGSAPVHIIADITQMTRHPGIASEVMKASRYLNHPALGWLVISGEVSTLVRSILNIFERYGKTHIKTVASLEEAIRFLDDQEPRHDATA
jgi:hypothetical protein